MVSLIFGPFQDGNPVKVRHCIKLTLNCLPFIKIVFEVVSKKKTVQ